MTENKEFRDREIEAVRARADRLHADLEAALEYSRKQDSKNDLINYRVGELEKAVGTIQTSVKNIESFVTRAGASGISRKELIGIIVGTVTVLTAVATLYLKMSTP